ncbi:MAG TPA: hypothetical protein VMZ04_06795 [Anaerolineae bacterium]|nr:hypothetical protein [Anaerolineae bacterium]
MSYLKGLKPKNLMRTAFGSYGWSGEAVRQLENILNEMKIERAGESINVQYIPDYKELERCRILGTQIAEKLKK